VTEGREAGWQKLSGEYFDASKEPGHSSPLTDDHEVQERLWRIAEELTGLYDEQSGKLERYFLKKQENERLSCCIPTEGTAFLTSARCQNRETLPAPCTGSIVRFFVEGFWHIENH
jgi:hypothetical protein